jgi:Acetyltransferase (GNAT) domain
MTSDGTGSVLQCSSATEQVVRLRPFELRDSEAWDACVLQAGAGTFLHTRRFLSYHAQRFEDRSLVVTDDRGGVSALFPAALDLADDSTVVSHPGITYGGLLHDGRLVGSECLRTLEAICGHYSAQGLRRLRYKAVPSIYHWMPAQDDLYALFRIGASLYRRDLSCAIDLSARARPSERRRRGWKRALGKGVEVVEGFDRLGEFWAVLEENLFSRHQRQPVHTLEEIQLVHGRFPAEIRLLVAVLGDEVVAGTLLFDSARVSHCQYTASSVLGREISALDAVFEAAVALATREHRRYFDFGVSTENSGRELNDGLHDFKAGFGGAGVAHDFYEVQLA